MEFEFLLVAKVYNLNDDIYNEEYSRLPAPTQLTIQRMPYQLIQLISSGELKNNPNTKLILNSAPQFKDDENKQNKRITK